MKYLIGWECLGVQKKTASYDTAFLLYSLNEDNNYSSSELASGLPPSNLS